MKFMKELAKHIASLLLENDCVIIPDFGGFIAHYMPAQVNAEEHIFLPPMRIIGFNPQLRINDGLLAQSYMSVYGTTFPDAVKKLKLQSKELTATLHKEGSMELENVGELRYSIRGQYDFIPFDNRLTTPSLYGFDSFKIQKIKDLSKEIKVEVERSTQPVSTPVASEAPTVEKPSATLIELPETVSDTQSKPVEKPAKVVDFSKYWYRAGAVAAMLVLIFASFLITSQITNSGIKNTEASVLPKETLQQSMGSIITHQPTNQSITENEQVEDVDKVALSDKPTETNKQETASITTSTQALTTSQATQAKKLYNVIVASVGNAEAAQKAAEDLIKQGYSHAKAIIGDGKARVSVESFEIEADAYRAIHQFQINGQFDQAWVLRR